MITLTIGQVSAIIAALVFAVQILLPNALSLILVSVLKNQQSTVTWSVVERNLLSSLWPLILRTDAAASRGVDRSVKYITWFAPLGLALVSIAAVITPLGLYEVISPSSTTEEVAFSYLADSGPMNYGTPPHNHIGFTRSCGNKVLL